MSRQKEDEERRTQHMDRRLRERVVAEEPEWDFSRTQVALHHDAYHIAEAGQGHSAEVVQNVRLLRDFSSVGRFIL